MKSKEREKAGGFPFLFFSFLFWLSTVLRKRKESCRRCTSFWLWITQEEKFSKVQLKVKPRLSVFVEVFRSFQRSPYIFKPYNYSPYRTPIV